MKNLIAMFAVMFLCLGCAKTIVRATWFEPVEQEGEWISSPKKLLVLQRTWGDSWAELTPAQFEGVNFPSIMSSGGTLSDNGVLAVKHGGELISELGEKLAQAYLTGGAGMLLPSGEKSDEEKPPVDGIKIIKELMSSGDSRLSPTEPSGSVSVDETVPISTDGAVPAEDVDSSLNKPEEKTAEQLALEGIKDFLIKRVNAAREREKPAGEAKATKPEPITLDGIKAYLTKVKEANEARKANEVKNDN